MHLHLLRHHSPATNGAPQTVAVGFASLIFFTLLFPFALLSVGDVATSNALIQLVRTDSGFNVFVLLLLLAPAIGVGVALLARSAWRIGTMLVALVALVMIPLALGALGRGLQTATHGMETVSPGLGSFILVFGYVVLAVATGVTAFRARHS